MIVLLACAQEPEPEDTGFRVLGVIPEDGATDATEAQTPELHFSDPIDEAACDEETIRLDAVKTDGTVAFNMPIVLDANKDGNRVSLTHGSGLVRGWTYAITVRGGAQGCTDFEGRVVLPFQSSFVVP